MGVLDLLVVAGYALAVLLIGVRAGRGHDSAEDLLLGGRALSGPVVLLSMLATELSAATFIGVPHAAYTGDWSYLQLAFGALLGKTLLSWQVIPLYHRLGVVTVYGFLGRRFGPLARRSAALCFIGGRLLASGVRLFIAALAVSAVTGFGVEAAIVAAGVLAALYTSAGGIRAVVYTDVLQAGVFLVSAAAVLVVLEMLLPGGLGGALAAASGEGRTRVLHLEPWISLASSRPFGVGLIGGFFLTLATHGTDHDMVQRLLTTRDGASGGRALFGSALLNFPVTLLFLVIGTGLAALYADPPAYDISDSARILPLFALHELPDGVRGLLFAGVFAAAMSSLDSAICAIATTWSVDVAGRSPDDASLARRSRWASALTGALLIGAALLMAGYHDALAARPEAAGPPFSLVDLALSSMTILYGGLLGVFALGMLLPGRGSDRSATLALLVGAACGGLLFVHPLLLGRTLVAWPFYIPLSAAVTLALGASVRRRR